MQWPWKCLCTESWGTEWGQHSRPMLALQRGSLCWELLVNLDQMGEICHNISKGVTKRVSDHNLNTCSLIGMNVAMCLIICVEVSWCIRCISVQISSGSKLMVSHPVMDVLPLSVFYGTLPTRPWLMPWTSCHPAMDVLQLSVSYGNSPYSRLMPRTFVMHEDTEISWYNTYSVKEQEMSDLWEQRIQIPWLSGAWGWYTHTCTSLCVYLNTVHSVNINSRVLQRQQVH